VTRTGLRVVAGELGGRRLEVPPAVTRPTADRVREALFSILGDVSELRVLDLFAGSGALGIEALSRGAREAVFVDNSSVAVSTLGDNLRALGLEGQVHHHDALSWLAGAGAREAFALVFCDPPYDLAESLAGQLAKALPPILTQDGRIVTESDKRSPLELPFGLVRERTYGDTRIAVHRGG